MDRPSVFDYELADLAQDLILRRRRRAGDQTPLSDREYSTLVEQVVVRRIKAGHGTQGDPAAGFVFAP